MSSRKEDLLKKLAARTNPNGSAKPGYAENVAAIRAELEAIEERAMAIAQDAQMINDMIADAEADAAAVKAQA